MRDRGQFSAPKIQLTERAAAENLALAIEEREYRAYIKRDRQLLTDDLAAFVRAAWGVIEPGRQLVWSWHYDLICEYLTLVRDNTFGQHFPNAKGLIINVPPRTAKSTLVTICFAVWCWLSQATRRFLFASYSAELSLAHSVGRRDLIRSPWFQERFSHLFKLKIDVNRQDQFHNDRTGQMIATSIGGAVTGRGGDDLILDDPLSPDQAASEIERNKANHWMGDTFRSRFNDPANGTCVMVMQRLHELDTTGFVLAQEPDRWLRVQIPLEAEERTEYRFPISGRVHVREAGNILQPSRFPANEVKSLKISRLTFAGQYQQRPAPLEGNMIRRSDVRYYGGYDPLTGVADPELPTTFDWVLISVDCAFKDLKTSDYVAIGAIGVKDGKRYLLNVVNAHLDLPATEAECLRQRRVYGASMVLVEDKANGSAVVKSLHSKIAGVIPVNPEGSKTARMFASAGAWQSHSWFVDRNAAWTGPFIEQIVSFPNAAHDDMVDMMTQAEVRIAHGFARPSVTLAYDPDDPSPDPIEGIDF